MPATPGEIRDACERFVRAGDVVRESERRETVLDGEEKDATTSHGKEIAKLATARVQLAQAELDLRQLLQRP